jgi:exodeoxyribonuclease V beta subunit
MSSHRLDPLNFPLHGSRLIEASAGTGKTWTIAALYLRLVLGPDPDPDFDGDPDTDPGHGGVDRSFGRALLPAEILVMTFTRAATRELSNRVRERLIEAALHFRGKPVEGAEPDAGLPDDPYLDALLESYPTHEGRQQAARRLMLAAETMDEAAIFTIDAWCQRMLREHAFDSGSLFDEELLSDEQGLFDDAAHDYWRQQVYPLNAAALGALLACWPDVNALKLGVRELVKRTALLTEVDTEADAEVNAALPLSDLIRRFLQQQRAALATLKSGWFERAERMEAWIAARRSAEPKCFNGNKMRAPSLLLWFSALRDWALDPDAVMPALSDTAWRRLTPDGIVDACSKGYSVDVPDDFDAITVLKQALDNLEPLAHALLRHGALAIGGRMQALKQRARQFGFADLPLRLENALLGPNGEALRERIAQQYPVVLVDEFQDTAPGQYRILDLLYRVKENDAAHGLFLIGDPKQSIYGFRGADIHSYLAARAATEGRHYRLDTNFRSTTELVGAVNALFLHAEGDGKGEPGFPAGAFRFRGRDGSPGNPLPFDAVGAQGRKQHLVAGKSVLAALTIACNGEEELKADAYRTFFAHHCAEHIVALLNDPQAGFEDTDGSGSFVRLQAADIAVLVRDRNEAGEIRKALQQRNVASVYLSDKDSVVDSLEAADVLRWLCAMANAQDGALARAAFATRTIGLSLAQLSELASDELAWEERALQIKEWHLVWQRQGVLAMLRRLIHELDLPAALLKQPGGERRLTNLLHLAELLQSASRQLDGEQALIRWLGEQIAGHGDGLEERVLRLESDAELVQVVTVHKSKGLEYPLVYLPFAVTARKVDKRNRSFFEFTDDTGVRHIDLALSDTAQQAVEAARIDEDVRLLYVAATRACHFLWLGVAAQASRTAGENTLHESAFGYLLAGGAPVALDQLVARCAAFGAASAAIEVLELDDGSIGNSGGTALDRVLHGQPLIDAARFEARFERDWTVGSFTSLTRQVGMGLPAARAPARALEETLFEDADADIGAPGLLRTAPLAGPAPWHGFPRGSVPGNFLHEQLEWLAGCGFKSVDDAHFATRLGARCERAGWGHRQDDVVTWLRAIAATPLPVLGIALDALDLVLPEMEFWCPSERLSSVALDLLCTRHLLGDTVRPPLPGRTLHGMLKGFADLVFEHEGRYWVLDYKSNWLGAGDGAYHAQALAQAMAQHRYDIQGALYMQALHRLLRSRLGALYQPQQHLGGAIFLFLRGIGNPHTHGCCVLEPEMALLDGLDRLLNEPADDRIGDRVGDSIGDILEH